MTRFSFQSSPLESPRKFVRSNITNGGPQFVALRGKEVLGWCDILPMNLEGNFYLPGDCKQRGNVIPLINYALFSIPSPKTTLHNIVNLPKITRKYY